MLNQLLPRQMQQCPLRMMRLRLDYDIPQGRVEECFAADVQDRKGLEVRDQGRGVRDRFPWPAESVLRVGGLEGGLAMGARGAGHGGGCGPC